MSFLLRNVLHFTRLLHRLGLDVQAGRARDAAAALAHVDVGRRADFRHTLRSLLIHRAEDLAPFDEAFRVFWRRPHGDWTGQDLRALGETRRSGAPEYESEAPESDAGDAGQDGGDGRARYRVERMAVLSYSDRESLYAKDFEHFTEEELAAAERMLARLQWDLGVRASRRWQAGRGPAPDLRRAVRANMRYGGELLDLPERRRRTRRRPLILLCDVSGSMERYSRMLLHFVHALTGGGRLGRVESFVFATRLTRITRQLVTRRAEVAVPRLPRTIADFGGGTRIGDALRAFNVEWARRVRGRGPLVLLISDGWDRGDPERLRTEIARLQRSCHRLIWLNPLLGSPDYVPLTRGMQAALPSIDDFLPVHNLASLEALASHLNTLPAHRPARRQGGLVSVVGKAPA